jgi:hypothetical protein
MMHGSPDARGGVKKVKESRNHGSYKIGAQKKALEDLPIKIALRCLVPGIPYTVCAFK